MKTRKNTTGPHASVHFENGAKCQKLMKTRKIYNRIACLRAFRKWANCQQMQKNAHENEKNITGPHASVYFQNEPNAKNARENEKIYNRVTCLWALRKWAKCQKRLKSTELNKKFHNRSTSEGKMKDVVARQPTLWANCKLCKVSLAHTLTK